MYKGFKNDLDSNNCFINAVLQALFHQPEFRYSVRNTKILHSPILSSESDSFDCSCIICSLKVIEQELRTPDSMLSPLSIRQALLSQHHINVNEMGDAIEAYEDIMELLHSACEADAHSLCIAHNLFAWTQQITATCPVCDNQLDSQEFLWHFPLTIYQFSSEDWETPGILSLIKKQQERNRREKRLTCDKHHPNSRFEVHDWISNYPPIAVISCIYTTPSQPECVLFNLLTCITETSSDEITLQSIVCYRGYHYTCISHENSKGDQSAWVEYSDGNKQFFFSTGAMIQYCIETNSLPVLLVFSKERQDSIEMNYEDWIVDEQLGSSVSDEQEERFSFSSAINFFQKLFTSEGEDRFQVQCPSCNKVIIVAPDVLTCPNCNNPLP
ncbi:hypothetical protein WA171_000504 [Blastocystis sp. BT1]